MLLQERLTDFPHALKVFMVTAIPNDLNIFEIVPIHRE